MDKHKRFITNDEPLTLGQSVFLFIVGILLGTVFIFGMQFWNEAVTKEDCSYVETQVLDFKEIKQRGSIKEIAVDCANGERYFIDGVSVNEKLIEDLSELDCNENVELLLHPDSDTIVELSNNSIRLLVFDETISELAKEENTFLYIGVFMYLASLLGLICIVLNINKKIKAKKQ